MHGGPAQAWRPVEGWLVPLLQARILGSQFGVLALIRNVVGVVANLVEGILPLLLEETHPWLRVLLLLFKHLSPTVRRIPPRLVILRGNLTLADSFCFLFQL